MRILVAEDDEALGNFVRLGLEAEHYAVDVSASGDQVRDLSQATNYDLLLLDLGLPNLDGKTVLRQVRVKKPTLPVLVLSARSRVQERVECLDLGADDFLSKPFAFAELSARIRALLRRCHTVSEAVLEVGDLRLDRLGRVVERAGKKIDLTVREFALLEYMMKNAGRRITRSMIAEHVWSASFDTPSNLIDVYVAYTLLYAIERMAGVHTKPCVALPSVVRRALDDLRYGSRPHEVVLDGVQTPREIAQVTRGYAATLGAQDIITAACCEFVWVRFVRPAHTTDLLFRTMLRPTSAH